VSWNFVIPGEIFMVQQNKSHRD